MLPIDLRFIIGMSILAVVGIGVWIWSWYAALNGFSISLKLALLGPFLAIIGVGYLVMPLDPDSPYAKAVQHAKQSGHPIPLKEMPMKYQILTVISLFAGAANVYSIWYWFC